MTPKIIILFFILLFFGACSDNLEQKKKKNYQNHDKTLSFSISDCQQTCYADTGQVFSKTLFNDTLSLFLGHWLNCIYQSDGSFEGFDLDQSNLNIFIAKKPCGFEVEPNGDTSFSYCSMGCNCYFNMEFKLKGISSIPKTISINGFPVENYKGLNE